MSNTLSLLDAARSKVAALKEDLRLAEEELESAYIKHRITKHPIKWSNVLAANTITSFSNLQTAARSLGHEYLLWNDQAYVVDSGRATGFYKKDFIA